MNDSRLLTVGQIASLASVPTHRVIYVLKTRSIQPTARAGKYRLYDAESVRRIVAALHNIDAVNAKGGCE